MKSEFFYRITVLIENTALPEQNLLAEHGLSLLVETPESTVLFDCGQTGAAWKNASRLGIDLSSVRSVILSHSHYDHAGGLPSLMQHAKPRLLYTGPVFWREKFSHDRETGEYKYRGCGFRKEDLAAWGMEQRICEGLVQIDSQVWIVHGFSRRYPFETIPAKFVCGEEKEPDTFRDEICLVLKEKDGLAVVTGCAHNGILNIVSSVKEKINLPVHRIVGGIHLSGEKQERVDKTLAMLREMGIHSMNLCHCSGDAAGHQIAAGTRMEVID